MSRLFRNKSAGEIVKKLVTKIIIERNLITEGDRVLIAVSGGKDSSVLAWALSQVKPALKLNYELAALHISTDFCACCKKNILREKLEEWGIPFTDLFVPVIARLKKNRKMNCYWCSTQRRTELLKYAVENGYNKIALGHHLDDIIETFFMNLLLKGTLLAMPILMKYRRYPVSLIRPLALLEEKSVISCANEQNILKNACTCPYGQKSKRRDIRDKIEVLTGLSGETLSEVSCGKSGSGDIKRRMLRALGEGETDYLTE